MDHLSLRLVSQTIRKVHRDETSIGDVSGTWISHRKKVAHSAPTDVPRVGEICSGISSSLIFYSPDDWGLEEETNTSERAGERVERGKKRRRSESEG